MSRYLIAAQLLFYVAVAGMLAWILYKLFGNGVFSGANWLKEKTPLGAPSRAIDTVISSSTGREETLGGWLNEILDPNAAKVREMTAPLKSIPLSPYSINPRDRT